MALSEKTRQWLASDHSVLFVRELVEHFRGVEQKAVSALRANVGDIDDYNRGTADALNSVCNTLINNDKPKVVNKPVDHSRSVIR